MHDELLIKEEYKDPIFFIGFPKRYFFFRPAVCGFPVFFFFFFFVELVGNLVMEGHEISSGWPLGLEVMNLRLRVAGNSQASAVAAGDVQPYSLHTPPFPSFSSFSSSNLDTESTVSFFQDRSVTLGRLIGIKPSDRGRLYFPSSIRFEENGGMPKRVSHSDHISKGHSVEMSSGICIPLVAWCFSEDKPRREQDKQTMLPKTQKQAQAEE